MALYKWGLVCNLIGSILLGLHIVGIERLKSWESKVKNLPNNISKGIFFDVVGPVLKTSLQRQMMNWPGGPTQWALDLKKHLKAKKGISLPEDWLKLRRNFFLYQFVMALLISILVGAVLWFMLLPLMLPFLIFTKSIAILQKSLQLRSFFGLLGILLLIVGFILQIIA